MFDAESYIMWHLRKAVGVAVWCMLRIWWVTFLLRENNINQYSNILDTKTKSSGFHFYYITKFFHCISKYNKPNQLKKLMKNFKF